MRTFKPTASTFTSSATGTAMDLGANTDNDACLAALLISSGYNQTSITFEASFDDGATWVPVINVDGTAYTVTCTASTAQAVALPPADLSGFTLLRPKAPGSVTSATITPIMRKV